MQVPVSDSKKSTLLIVFVTIFIDLLGFGIVLPLLPRYGELFQANENQLGLLMASFSAMQFLFAPMWGALSDRVGRRPILLLGLAGSTVSYALFGLASSLTTEQTLVGLSPLTWLFITRIGAGISGATISTAQAVIADSTQARGRGKGMAMIGAAFGIGFTFGPLIGAACIQGNTPLGLPGYVAAGLSGAALLVAWWKLPETRKEGDTGRMSRSWISVGQIARHLGQPKLSVTLLAIFITTFGFALFESTLSLLTERLGYDLRWNFLLYSYVGLVLTLGQGLLVRRLLPSVGEKRMAIAGSALMTFGFVLVGGTGAGWDGLPPASIWLILPVIVIGFSAVTPSLQSMLSLASGSEEQGTVLGTGQSLSSLARIIGPYVGIRMLEYSTARPYYLGALLIGLGGAFIIFIRGPVKTEPETPSISPETGT